jgi:hypothetical protein
MAEVLFRELEYIDTKRAAVFVHIDGERSRQEALKTSGKFAWTLAERSRKGGHAILDSEKLAVLAEEFGEVAKEVVDGTIADDSGYPTSQARQDRLRAELIQVAACCVAWIEAIDHA